MVEEGSGFRLLCQAARGTGADPAELPQAALAVAGADFVRAALSQRVAAPVLAAFSAHAPQSLSAEDLAALRRQADPRRALAQAGEVLRLAAAFEAAGVRVLLLKGVVLSQQLYANPARRPAGDIDLLVEPDRIAEAGALLESLAYRPLSGPLTDRRLAAFVKGAKDLVYKSIEGRGLVELHHRLTSNPRLFPTDFEALWRGRATVRLGGMDVPTLPEDDLALYLCIHGASHCWERLRWLLDFADLLAVPGAVSTALARAEAAGLLPPMQQALLLAHRWLGLTLEPRQLEAADTSRKVARLERLRVLSLGGEAWRDGPGRMARIVWMRLHRYHLKSDWRYLVREAALDWDNRISGEVMALPDSLLWLNPFLRPLGWVTRSRHGNNGLRRPSGARSTS